MGHTLIRNLSGDTVTLQDAVLASESIRVRLSVPKSTVSCMYARWHGGKIPVTFVEHDIVSHPEMSDGSPLVDKQLNMLLIVRLAEMIACHRIGRYDCVTWHDGHIIRWYDSAASRSVAGWEEPIVPQYAPPLPCDICGASAGEVCMCGVL